MSNLGFLLYLLTVTVALIAGCVFLLRRQVKERNAAYEADLSRASAAAGTRVAAIDEAGKALSAEELITAFRRDLLLDGCYTVALASFTVVVAVAAVLVASERFGGERLRGVRASWSVLGAVACGWLLLGVLTLLARRWAIWGSIGITSIAAVVGLVIVLNGMHDHGRTGLLPPLCVLKVFPAVRLARAVWRMNRAGIPLTLRVTPLPGAA